MNLIKTITEFLKNPFGFIKTQLKAELKALLFPSFAQWYANAREQARRELAAQEQNPLSTLKTDQQPSVSPPADTPPPRGKPSTAPVMSVEGKFTRDVLRADEIRASRNRPRATDKDEAGYLRETKQALASAEAFRDGLRASLSVKPGPAAKPPTPSSILAGELKELDAEAARERITARFTGRARTFGRD